MDRRILALLGVFALAAGTLACNSADPATPVAPAPTGSSAAAPDGSTLKVPAPVPQSPADNVKLTTPVVVLSVSGVTGEFVGNVPLQYRFQVLNAANNVVDSALVNGTSWQVTATLNGNTRYTWRARAESQNEPGPWSTTTSFITVDPAVVFDPLTNGQTVGKQVGGQFVPGRGWQSLSRTHGIDYDVPTCSDCRLEFDITNIGRAEGFPFERDLKFVSMGEAGAYSSFAEFRNHRWKMQLEQRADGNGTGMKITWRNGKAGDGEPGDHTIKVDPAVNWQSSQVFHFTIDWSPRGFTVAVDGRVWIQDGFGGHAYAPSAHRISLGCYPRTESFVGAIYSNVKLTKH